MDEMLVNILAGLLTSALGFGLGAVFTRVKISQRLGHIERLLPADRRVQVVLPSASVGDFAIKGEAGSVATFPPNVLIMPMPEGSGIARLVLGLRSLPRKVHILLTTDDEVSPEYALTFSIGGPSVNMESRRLVDHHPQFKIVYPGHEASFGAESYVPRRSPDGSLQEDFGFLLAHTEDGRTSIVCCGVWGTGTESAIRGLLDLSDRRLGSRLRRSKDLFIAFQTRIHGLRTSKPQLLHAFDEGESLIKIDDEGELSHGLD
ncbi:hypothetical protein PSN13_05174 [Micromonospora saelicesensis]|uniref:Uncharacterized protein n=1 Tax=Micromonospora saelicesensis TaxID=285676 RepID=A0A328NL44_9ACTN|nr:hypothetical protein [Micromonospora saelicesensis]RAO29975.1 hypothetical protein PSN13_05174 [Micromonospora saelicesensis]